MSALDLYQETFGGGDKTVIIAHGFLGSARNWRSIARYLGQKHQIIIVDMRNHYRSPWSPLMTYEAMASDLINIARSCQKRDITLIGHSMGGKAVMMAGLTEPDLFHKLAVLDIAPVSYKDHIVELEGHLKALLALSSQEVASRKEADHLLSSSIIQPDIRAFLLQNFTFEDKRARALSNLDVLYESLHHITGWPEPEGKFDGETLFLSGGLSNYVLEQHHNDISQQFSQAGFQSVNDAGHWLHAQKPRETLDAIEAFLER